MKLCLDVGHVNVEDPNAPEANPYEWIKRYGKIAPIIHIQQTNNTASCHWPFTPEFNEKGNIHPEKVIAAIEESGAEECLLAFEMKEKAFYPSEQKVINNLRDSINFWREYVKK